MRLSHWISMVTLILCFVSPVGSSDVRSKDSSAFDTDTIGGIDASRTFLTVFTKDDTKATPFISVALSAPTSVAMVTVRAPNNLHLLDEEFELGGKHPYSKIMPTGTSNIRDNWEFARIVDDRHECQCMIGDVWTGRPWISSNKLYTSGAFLVLPWNQLSTYYMAVTSCRATECFILVASCLDHTLVQMRLRAVDASQKAAFNITYNAQLYSNGSLLTETLQAYESLQLLAEEVDLTGTLISSNQPVVVVSGGVLDKASDFGRPDKVVEQMPPIKSLERSYVIKVQPESPSLHFEVHVATPFRGTRLEFYGKPGDVTTVRGNDVIQSFRFRADVMVILEASHPVLVVYDLPSPYTKGATLNGEPERAFVLAMPSQMWGRHFTVSIFKLTKAKNIIMAVVTSSADCSSPFLIDGKEVDAQSASWVTADRYRATTLHFPFSNTSYQVTNALCPFGGYVMASTGVSNKIYLNGWAYALAWHAQMTNRMEPGPDLGSRPQEAEDQTMSSMTTSTTLQSGPASRNDTHTTSLAASGVTNFNLNTEHIQKQELSASSSVISTTPMSHQTQTESQTSQHSTPQTVLSPLATPQTVFSTSATSQTVLSSLATPQIILSTLATPQTVLSMVTDGTSTPSLATHNSSKAILRKSLSAADTAKGKSSTGATTPTTWSQFEGTALLRGHSTTSFPDYQSDSATEIHESIKSISSAHVGVTSTVKNLASIPSPVSTFSGSMIIRDETSYSIHRPSDSNVDWFMPSPTHLLPPSIDATASSTHLQNSALAVTDMPGQALPTVTAPRPDTPTDTFAMCSHACAARVVRIAKLTEQEKQRQSQAIVQELKVDKHNVSKAIRKKISATNKQISSVYFGSVITCCTFTAVGCLLVIPDLIRLANYCYKYVMKSQLFLKA